MSTTNTIQLLTPSTKLPNSSLYYKVYVTVSYRDSNGNHIIPTYETIDEDENSETYDELITLPLEDIYLEDLTSDISPDVYYNKNLPGLVFDTSRETSLTFKWKMSYPTTPFSNLSYYSEINFHDPDPDYTPGWRIELVNSANQSSSDVNYWESFSGVYIYTYDISTNVGINDNRLLPRLTFEGSGSVELSITDLSVSFVTNTSETVYDTGLSWTNHPSGVMNASPSPPGIVGSVNYWAVSKYPIDISDYPGYPSEWRYGTFDYSSGYSTVGSSLADILFYTYPYPISGFSGQEIFATPSSGSLGYLADKYTDEYNTSSDLAYRLINSGGSELTFEHLKSISNTWYPGCKASAYTTGLGDSGFGYSSFPPVGNLIKPSASPFKINKSGAWKDVPESYVNINGSWKKVTKSYVKISDSWKECK